jgi:CheY-like chemotaxis protein
MPRTILIADDSPTIRRLVSQTFADANFQIVEVNNGDAAIKTFDEVRPSVVLADIYMPGKNGYQVCSYIRSHPRWNRTPVVLLVGAFDAFDEQAAAESGATANITKPFEPSVLINLVTSVMLPETSEVEDEPPTPGPKPELAPELADDSWDSSSQASEEDEVTDPDDLLGLNSIFQDEPQTTAPVSMTEDVIDRIADRVIERLSTQIIESVAWDVVPDIAEKVVREELKRIHES